MPSQLRVTETLHTVFVPASRSRIVTAVGVYTHHVVSPASTCDLGWSPAPGARRPVMVVMETTNRVADLYHLEIRGETRRAA